MGKPDSNSSNLIITFSNDFYKFYYALSLASTLKATGKDISIFISGKRPSGSSDPYALRRNLNGVIKIIWNYELDLPLDKLFNELIDFWKIVFPNLNFSRVTVFNDLNEFLVQRIVSHLEELSLSKEIIKAICSSDELSQKRVLNIVDLKNRINSIINFNDKDNFVEIQ